MTFVFKNVRLSFPALWKAKSIQGGAEKFSAAFLLDKEKDKEQISAFKAAMKQVAEEKWGKTLPKGIKQCLRDGSEKDYDGYGDSVMFVTASADKRPQIVDRDRSQLAEEDGKPYGGCYVNGAVRLWSMDNAYGRKINAELSAIQFVRDGEPFSSVAPVKVEEVFENLGEDASSGDDDPLPF